MLVLGGLGFIGLNLVQRLISSRVKVMIFSRSQPQLALRWLDQIVGEATKKPILYQGDLRNPDSYRHLIASSDVIFNLAGQSGAAQSLIEAHADMQINVEGNLALLEAIAQTHRLPRIVFISSRLVYGATDSILVDEDQPFDAH